MEEELKQGTIGMRCASGEVVLTATGRKTTPFPQIRTGSERDWQRTLDDVDKWLISNALEEAKARRDEWNEMILGGMSWPYSPADKDYAEYYLFSEDYLHDK